MPAAPGFAGTAFRDLGHALMYPMTGVPCTILTILVKVADRTHQRHSWAATKLTTCLFD